MQNRSTRKSQRNVGAVELIEETSPDVIVLARYMQIFPAWLCQKYLCQVINIHHSFFDTSPTSRPWNAA